MHKTHYIIPVFVPDLGCPHQCVFCSQKKITGIVETPTPQKVKETIDRYLLTIPEDPAITKEVAFYGGSFTAIDKDMQRELLTPAYQALASGKINGLRVSTRPDAVSEEKLALLSAYGVNTIELGVQSMDDEVLAASGRGHTSRDVLRATAFVKAWGIQLGYQMMVGLPADSAEKNLVTAAELIGLEPDMVRIYPCLVLKDTPLAQMYKNGSFSPLNIDEAVERCRKLLVMFEKAGIKVIRIGLQPSEQINLEGDVLAGPYHPAFRELVESAAAREQVDYLLESKAGIKAATNIVLAVPEEDISVVRGHRASNVKYFKEKYGIDEYVTEVDKTLGRGVIRLVTVDGRQYGISLTRTELPE